MRDAKRGEELCHPQPRAVYTVGNLGGDTVPSQSRWDDLIYLSRDEFLDIRADQYMGQQTHTGGLAAGATYTVTRTLRAPS
ncbi:MAG: hypothetical protein FJ276_37340, partial [Planctomycetes bacterium]|nr:hypothetical protein [Planctomycetota bacterium]